MKFIVDEMPKSVDKCPFSKLKTIRGNNCSIYCCEIPTYQPKLGLKARCVCKSVDKCNVLVPLKEVK